MAVIETVDLGRLNMLLENGFLTQDEYDGLVYRETRIEKNTGKFHIQDTGIIERANKSSIESLEFIISEAERNTNQLDLFSPREQVETQQVDEQLADVQSIAQADVLVML